MTDCSEQFELDSFESSPGESGKYAGKNDPPSPTDILDYAETLRQMYGDSDYIREMERLARGFGPKT